MSRNFQYQWTCPEIDKNITNFEQVISDVLDDIIYELNPMFYQISAEKIKYREALEKSIYENVSDIFENVRKCNSDIREEAESVIENLKSELEQANSDKDYWEREAEQKDDKISDLEYEIEDLKIRLQEYE